MKNISCLIVILFMCSCANEEKKVVKKVVNKNEILEVKKINDFSIKYSQIGIEIYYKDKLNSFGLIEDWFIVSLTPTVAEIVSDVGVSSLKNKDIDIVTFSGFGAPIFEAYLRVDFLNNRFNSSSGKDEYRITIFLEKGQKPIEFKFNDFLNVIEKIKEYKDIKHKFCIFYMDLPFTIKEFENKLSIVTSEFNRVIFCPSINNYLDSKWETTEK